MNKKIITYGVSGMLEWHALLKVGNSHLKLNFTGGALSGYGVTPATFTTDNPAVQHIIENSQEFQTGRIRIVRSNMIEKAENNPRLKIIRVANEIERDKYLLSRKLINPEHTGDPKRRDEVIKANNLKFVFDKNRQSDK